MNDDYYITCTDTILEMDLFPDAESLDTFSELQQEEQRLREELIFSSADININRFLQEGENQSSSGIDSVSPFHIEFNNESLSHSPSSMFMIQNENSTSSASSSVDIDLDIGNNQIPNNATTFVDTFTLSPCMDSPPLTPPEVKVDITAHGQTNLVFTSSVNTLGTSIRAVNDMNLPKLIPALKSNKRGRSASHDDSPDVQALKRHIRMIRNRESASLSRKKKKEYVTGLEDRIKGLEKENEGLKRENIFLRSKLQQNGIKLGAEKKKSHVVGGVVAKVALLGLFGFVMINFNSNPRPTHPMEHSNVSDFSRTLTKLRLAEASEGEDHTVTPLLAHQQRFIPRAGDIDLNYTKSSKSKSFTLENINSASDGTYGSLSNISHIAIGTANSSMHENSSSIIGKPMSYLNGTAYNNQTHQVRQTPTSTRDGNTSSVVVNNNVKRERERSNSSRWRSRGISNKKKMTGWPSSSLKSANWVFPPFMGSTGVSNSSNPQHTTNRCPNPFNKTESMRVKNDLEDIFGKGKFSQKKYKTSQAKISPVLKLEPIVYSLISHNMDASKNIIPRAENSDLNKGLAVYDGEKKRFSTILEKLERREDTFYVVSLASDNQLLLSAKASNESSRPKMTLLLPWRNETLNEDMILQIDCEVFQVFNLNDEKRKPKRQRSSA
ncbi:uncharacterized protein LOC110863030 isoform X2 [Folsomia candida]|uniref:uncharacterized protein LOC110863030 isoform X2 n=1 Tax=Folsomia candida TaxID=158441 RepID=UPI000B8FACA9|nr:uncharacterized protein LOC110863030 isoform X2 [Folsomia candida]